MLSADHLRKVLPVALAEHFISQTEDVYNKSPAEVIGELCQAVGSGQFPKYMVVLCNSRVEVVAHRRSLVRLEGYSSIIAEGKGKGRVERSAWRSTTSTPAVRCTGGTATHRIC